MLAVVQMQKIKDVAGVSMCSIQTSSPPLPQLPTKLFNLRHVRRGSKMPRIVEETVVNGIFVLFSPRRRCPSSYYN